MKSVRSWIAAGSIVTGSIVALLILSLFSAQAVFVQAQGQDDDAAARGQVLALEKAWNQAYKAGDIKALDAILDNSLVLVEDDGSLKTKSEFLAGVKKSTGNQEQVAPESLSVRIFGKTAIAIGVIAVKSTQHGKSVVRRERFIDTWINRNGSWICIGTDATPMTYASP
ncbi:MAG TPA: nuclear transport factor 2 family protein [Terriglobales bacterium]|nr:nuclear transport factor 2 family protein [Terriglobales bacterium]